MALGIKNSWKYEKDLMIILNQIDNIITITCVFIIDILNQDNLKKLSVGWGVFEHLLSNMKFLIAI